MKKYTWIAALVLILLALGIGAWWWLTAPEPLVQGSETGQPRSTSTESTGNTEPSKLAHTQARSTPDEREPATKVALQAALAATDMGYVVCPVPPGFLVAQRAHHLAIVQGDSLLMGVADASGSAILARDRTEAHEKLMARADELIAHSQDLLEAVGQGMGDTEDTDAEPFDESKVDMDWIAEISEATEHLSYDFVDEPEANYLLRWSGAEPGKQGRCTLHTQDELIEVTVHTVDAAGKPLVGAYVRAVGGNQGAQKTDSSGVATVQMWEGLRAAASASHPGKFCMAGMEGLGGAGCMLGAVEITANVGHKVIITLEPAPAADEPVGLSGVAGEMRERWKEGHRVVHDALVQAAADPALSPAVKAQLDVWVANEAQFTE